MLVLSRGHSHHATRRLAQECAAAGHDVTVLDPGTMRIEFGGGRPSRVLSGDRTVEAARAVVIPRIGSSPDDHGVAILRRLEASGASSINAALAIAAARDKFGCLDRLDEAGVPVPRTTLLRTVGALASCLAAVGGPPVIFKLRFGAQGVGVLLAESREAAEGIAQTLLALGQPVIVQRFVERSRGRDVRVLVVGGTVTAAMRRTARGEDFRANLARGGRAKAIDPDPRMERVAVAAVRTLGLGLAGVDLVEDDGGPLVLEVNASPGFEGLERATGRNLASRIVAFAATARPAESSSVGASVR